MPKIISKNFITDFCETTFNITGKLSLSRKDIKKLRDGGIKSPTVLEKKCKIENCRDKNIFSLVILDAEFGTGSFFEKHSDEFKEIPSYSEKAFSFKEETPITEELNYEEKINTQTKNHHNFNNIDENIKFYIPQINKNYVENNNENYSLLKNIITSKKFFPVYIYGIPGIGKTSAVYDICAKNMIPLIRCQITPETADSDLIGGWKIVNGNMKFEYGAITRAMKIGAICLLDEADTNNIMALQEVLEGSSSGMYIKETGELVYPKEGFNIISTGNTKGLGDTSGKYIGTTVINEAQLDRYAIILEQKPNTISEEKKIINMLIKNENIDIDKSVLNNFYSWIAQVRKTYESDVENVFVSTRRISYIIQCYGIVKNMSKAIELALSRFDDSEKDAFIMIWKAINSEN